MSKPKRVEEAADLHTAMHALRNVSTDQRMAFIHDRLMRDIETLCNGHGQGRPVFNRQQMDVLKDLAFRIYYVLDPVVNSDAGIVGKLRAEFEAQSAFGKVKVIAATALFGLGALNGALSAGQWLWERLPGLLMLRIGLGHP